jgi:protease-4
MAMNNDSTSSTTVMYVIVVVVAVLVASVLSPVVWVAFQSSDDEAADQPDVAVITLRGGTGSANIAVVSEQLRAARTNDSVEAVVLRIDSSGGAVTSSEEFYLAVNRTAAEMPVVAYVEGLAASGGYFGIAPADAIYVKPSSYVGSIGVIASITPAMLEESNAVNRRVMQTGPDKAVTTVDRVREELELLQNAFTNTVMTHRGDQLTLSREEVEHARIYRGTEAVENGFADELGSLESAIEHAAESSKAIDEDYDVTYVSQGRSGSAVGRSVDAVQAVNGSVVVVDRTEEPEFVKPVRYFAVYGLPADAVSEGEVVVNETS